jgi:hypothetical protein
MLNGDRYEGLRMWPNRANPTAVAPMQRAVICGVQSFGERLVVYASRYSILGFTLDFALGA